MSAVAEVLPPVVGDDRAARREAHKARVLPRLERNIAKAEARGEARVAASLRWAHDSLTRDNIVPYRCLSRLVRMPVTIEEFARSKEFIGAVPEFDLWPYWAAELRRMNPDVLCGEAPVREIALGGASGTGKSKIAQISVLYSVYLLSCFDSPGAVFPGYDGTTPLMVPVVSHKPSITRDIFYTPMRKAVEAMPYARRWMRWDKNKDAQLHFIDLNVTLGPFMASDTALSGQAIFSAILDEMNFMEVVERSTRVPGPRGQGGRLDQADLVYKEADSRSRRPPFGRRDLHVGKRCVLSNVRYEGDFMDRLLAYLNKVRPKDVYWRRLMRQNVAPDDVADMREGRTIRVLVGAPGYSSRVLEPEEREGPDYPVGARVVEVPDRYEATFRFNADNELRLVCGITTGVISPYLPRREMIAAMFGRGERLPSWVDAQDVDLTERGLPKWLPERMPNDRHVPRFVHVDLSRSKDRCGVAVVKIAGMAHVQDPDAPGVVERAPHYVVEVAVTIKPSGTAQIDPAEVRSWLMELGTLHGFEIGGASYDGFDSHESVQRWVKAGVRNVRVISTDRTTETCDHFRHALYQGRVNSVDSGILGEELLELEYNAEKDKVDHPPRGTKDLADAVMSAIMNASLSRGVRGRAGYVDEDSGERVRVRAKGRGARKEGTRSRGSTARRVLRERLRQSREG